MQAKGNIRVVLKHIARTECLMGEALGLLDTKDQYCIREKLEKAIEECQKARNKYDPL